MIQPLQASDPVRQLTAGLADLGLPAGEDTVNALLAFRDLIAHWNRHYNLVAKGDLGDFVARHLLDSLAVSQYIGLGNLLDAGTGAGLPGVPLAITGPQRTVTLVDSNGKKIRFLNHVVRALNLKNATPVQARLERFSPGVEFSTIISRAFTTLREFTGSVRHLAGADTRVLAMKGKAPTEELRDLPAWVRVAEIRPIAVPGLVAERHLVVMSLAA